MESAVLHPAELDLDEAIALEEEQMAQLQSCEEAEGWFALAPAATAGSDTGQVFVPPPSPPPSTPPVEAPSPDPPDDQDAGGEGGDGQGPTEGGEEGGGPGDPHGSPPGKKQPERTVDEVSRRFAQLLHDAELCHPPDAGVAAQAEALRNLAANLAVEAAAPRVFPILEEDARPEGVPGISLSESCGEDPPPAPSTRCWATPESLAIHGLRVATANVNGAGTLPGLLRAPQFQDVDVVLVQEHKIQDRDRLSQQSQTVLRLGWVSIWTPAVPGPKEGPSGGTAILARFGLGLSEVPEFGQNCPGRLTAARVQIPGDLEFLAVSLYLRVSEGLSEANVSLLTEAGALAHREGMPTLFGGDWNMAPELIAESRFVHGLQGELLVTDSCTHYPAIGRPERLDYYVATSGLAKGVREVEVIPGTALAPHRPVSAAFHPSVARLRALSFVKPQPIPAEPKSEDFVPAALRDWSAIRDLAEAASRAFDRREHSEGRRLLSVLYGQWANAAEEELVHATGAELRHRGQRGKHPKLEWRPIIRRDAKTRDHELAFFQWLHGECVALRGMMRSPGDSLERARCLKRLAKSTSQIPEQVADGFTAVETVAGLFGMWDGFAELPDAFPGALLEATEALTVQVERARSAALARGRASWKEWLLAGRGHRNIHCATRAQSAWQPSSCLSLDGRILTDPLSLLRSEAARYSDLWGEAEPKELPVCADPHPALPRLGAWELRRNAQRFSGRTAVSVDGFAMRHFALLSDPALEVLAVLLEAVEKAGHLPRQVELVMIALLPKASGGWRPIGLFPGIYRLWGRCRRPWAVAWERAHDRHYYAAGQHTGAGDVVWRQAVLSEAGVQQGFCSASVLWDMAKFYESFRHDWLLARALDTEFPPAIAHLALACYQMPRYFSLAGFAEGPFSPGRGVVAGCPIATTFVRVYTLKGYDGIPRGLLRFTSYIDDTDLAATGTRQAVIRAICDGAEALWRVAREDLDSTVAVEKVGMVASDAQLARALEARLGVLAGRRLPAATNLGVADTAGLPYRARGRTALAKKRMREARQRRTRLASLARTIGTRASKQVYMSGVLASECYGVEITGVSDGDLHRQRQGFASFCRPRAGQRSLTALLRLERDPVGFRALAPVVRYAKEVWACFARLHIHALGWRQLREAWQATFQRRPPLAWRAVRGPLSAAYLTLQRIGWSMESFTVLCTDEGERLSLTHHSPAMVQKLLEDGLQRYWEAQAAAKASVEGRLCFDVVHAELQSCKHSAFEKGCFKLLACGGAWTKEVAVARGYQLDDVRCDLCGLAPDTVWHRL